MTVSFYGCAAPTDSISEPPDASAAPEIILTTADTDTGSENAIQMHLDEIQGPCEITQAGTYLLSGTTSQGIVVDAQQEALIDTLMELEGVISASLVEHDGEVTV